MPLKLAIFELSSTFLPRAFRLRLRIGAALHSCLHAKRGTRSLPSCSSIEARTWRQRAILPIRV